jgi:4-amino-4-deoxy-L-arabinose transferase-like glycosyltransferase
MSRRTALLLLVLCLLVGAALRLPNLVEKPPGLHYDEAANGILAGDIGFRGERPVFIPSYTGKEPLFFYLAGSLMRLLGESVYSLRLTAALIGILTIAATYWFGKELLSDRRIALIAAALIAVSFWHVLFSRLGFRAISQPLLQALTIGALFHGLRRDSRLWMVAAGIMLGLSAYTYLAVRFFPIPLAIALIPLLFSAGHRKQRLGQLALFAVSGLVVLAPLAIYFMNNPDAFWVRAGQVFPDQSTGAALLESYWKSLGMLFVAGDPYWRFNIPDRPIFDWFLGLFMAAGWILAIVRLIRARRPIERSAYLLLILVPLFMLLPTALAMDEIVPSNLRAIGLLPFIILLPALALDAGMKLLRKQFRSLLGALSGMKPDVPAISFDNAIAIGIVLVLLGTGAATIIRTYYQEWTLREDLFYDSDTDLVAISEYLSEADLANQTLYLAAEHYRHPTMAFLSDQYEQIKWLPNSDALVLPDEGSALYIYPHSSPAPEWAQPYISVGGVSKGPEGPDGEPLYEVYKVPSPADPVIANPVNIRFENAVTLLGYALGSTGSGTVPVRLYWRVENPGPAGLQPFIHLEDEWGYRWSQQESFAYPAEQWTPGDVVIQQVDLPVAAGMPPGAYQIRIGFFDAATGEQLSALNNEGYYVGNGVSVTGIPVSNVPYPDPLPLPSTILDQPAGDNLTLVGFERAGDSVASGAEFGLSLWWNATGPLQPAAVRLELVGSDNSGPIVQNNTLPVHGTYAFENWGSPQFVIDHMRPRVADNVQPGEYTLRMRLLDAEDQTITMADLGMLTIEDANRLYNPPRTTHPLEAEFGSEIELLGYDLEQLTPSQYELRLIWRALTEPNDSYTVFVHVLNQDGTCCAWQQDIQPVQGANPTDGWLAREVVVDEYIIDMPPDAEPGEYQVEIGLYLPSNGLRLLVEVPGMRQRDVLYLTRPITVE